MRMCKSVTCLLAPANSAPVAAGVVSMGRSRHFGVSPVVPLGYIQQTAHVVTSAIGALSGGSPAAVAQLLWEP